MKLAAKKYSPLIVTVLLITVGGYVATNIGWSAGNDAADKVEIVGFKVGGADGDGSGEPPRGRTKKSNPDLVLKVTSNSKKGQLVSFVKRGIGEFVAKEVPEPVAPGATVDVALSGLEQGQYEVYFTWAAGQPPGANEPTEFCPTPVRSNTFAIEFDSDPPKLVNVEQSFSPDGNLTLFVHFDEDLSSTQDADLIQLDQESLSSGGYVNIPLENDQAPTYEGRTATMKMGKVPPGNYRITAKAGIKDQLTNATPEGQDGRERIIRVNDPPASAPPEIKPAADSPTVITKPDGTFLTGDEQFQVGVQRVPTGIKPKYFVNNLAQTTADSTVRLTDGVNRVRVSYVDSTNKEIDSNSLTVELDTEGPLLQRAEVIGIPTATGTGQVLVLTFVDDDLDTSSIDINDFAVKRRDESGFNEDIKLTNSPKVDGRTVNLLYDTLPPGEYLLEVLATVKDVAGNPAGRRGVTDAGGKSQKTTFSVQGERTYGKHVEFPPYTPPKPQPIPDEGFNPDDYVQTRVARLYYFRDAHRVAQILNRNIRSYNQAAVTQAERRAEQARDDFEEKVDDRRKAERDAVRSAQQARNAEAHLAQANEVLGIARELEADTRERETRLKDVNAQLKQHDDAVKEVDGQQSTVNSKRDALTQGQKDLAVLKEDLAEKTETLEKLKADLAKTETLLEQEKAKDPPPEASGDGSEPDDNPTILDPPDVKDPKRIQELEGDKTRLEGEIRLATEAKTKSNNRYTGKQLEVNGAATKLEEEETELAELKAEAKAIEARVKPAQLKTEKEQLDIEVNQLKDRQQSIGKSEDLQKTIESMQNSVANLRQTEIVKQEASHDAQALEDRAAKKQFREEVAAAEEDPDTYVAGDIGSVDPVTQVSISVIGEGLIHLRGPIKGINKVRTMINQIDAPVGQIKVGIFTVQVNGEKGEKMECVVGKAESNIDLSRFLVNQSLQYLRRSIQAEAAMIAEQCEMMGHYQVDRDRRYLYMFFGRDFIDELYELNSEFLFTENKLLSLHAMDTVSLNRALFILALAKNDVRERIVARFLETSQSELADAEYDFRRSSELNPKKTQKLFPPWNRTHLPVWNRPHEEERIFEAVHRNAMQRYHFRNVRAFFDVGFTHPDTMNPMQREFIRLAQIFKARLIAEMELKQRIIERGLIEDRSNDENQLRNAMDPAHTAALDQVRVAFLGLVTAGEEIKQAIDKIDELEVQFKDMREKIEAVAKLDRQRQTLATALGAAKNDNERAAIRPQFERLANQYRRTGK